MLTSGLVILMRKPLPGSQTDGEAERLVVGAAACWMGGLWSDALGEQPDSRAWGIARTSDPRAIARTQGGRRRQGGRGAAERGIRPGARRDVGGSRAAEDGGDRRPPRDGRRRPHARGTRPRPALRAGPARDRASTAEAPEGVRRGRSVRPRLRSDPAAGARGPHGANPDRHVARLSRGHVGGRWISGAGGWGGVLQGFADKLRADASKVSTRTPLPDVLGRVAARLDEEHRTLLALFEAERHAGRQEKRP